MDMIIDIFLVVFCGFWVLVIIAGISGSIYNYLSWKKVEGTEPAKRTEASDNFLIEMKRVLHFIEIRIRQVDDPYSKDEEEEVKDLYISSEVASLFRCAHYAGYHITFEQNETEWSCDPEYLDPDVFKTDMKEAAALREEWKWNEYKRYFDPPKSKRERALGK